MQREPATLCYDGNAVSGDDCGISQRRSHAKRLGSDLPVTKLMRSVVVNVMQTISD